MSIKEDLRHLKITRATQWQAIDSIVILGILCLGALFYYGFTIINIISILIIYMIDAVPVIIAHIRYFKRNKDESYYIRGDGFIYRKKGQAERFYPKEEIIGVKLFLSASAAKDSFINILSIGYYHYARIYLKDGSQLIVTSLMTKHMLAWHFGLIRGVKIKKVIRGYNFI